MTSPPAIWTRRRWLGAASLSLAATGAPATAKPHKAKTISIFHTTDLHGHIAPTSNYQDVENVGGLARCATQIKRWRAECPDHLLVDIGDVYQGTHEGLADKGQLMIKLFNAMRYDAWVIGNHDLDWGRPVIEAAIGSSACPVLTGNISVDGKPTMEAPAPWPKVKPWILKEVNGLRIAMIGLTTPGMPMWLTPETLGGIAAQDPLATLAAILPEVKAANPNAIILLGHMGWKFKDDEDNPVRALLDSTREIDVYLGGHSHMDQPSWKWNGAECSQAGYYGIWCGRVDLHFNAETGKLFDVRPFSVWMDDRMPPDDDVLAIAAPAIAAANTAKSRVLRVLAAPIGGGGRGSPLIAMMGKAFSTALAAIGQPVDGVFHGSFDTGDLPAGPLTVADAWKILPYENLLVTASLRTTDLLEIIAEDAKIAKSDRSLIGFTVTRDAAGNPTGLARDGKPTGPDDRFTIAINSYDSQSGGGRLPGLRDLVARPGAKRRMTGIETRDALVAWLASADAG